jgi:hypothetical protein
MQRVTAARSFEKEGQLRYRGIERKRPRQQLTIHVAHRRGLAGDPKPVIKRSFPFFPESGRLFSSAADSTEAHHTTDQTVR